MIWGPGCTEEQPCQPNIEALRNFSLTAEIGDSLTKVDTSPLAEEITPLLRL